MQAEETKMILRYFGGIEAQLDDVNIELAELRDRYNPILLFSPAGRVVSRCFVRFRAASFPDPGDNAHCRRRG